MKETIEKRLETLLWEVHNKESHEYIEQELRSITDDYKKMLEQFRSIWDRHVPKDNKNE